MVHISTTLRGNELLNNLSERFSKIETACESLTELMSTPKEVVTVAITSPTLHQSAKATASWPRGKLSIGSR